MVAGSRYNNIVPFWHTTYRRIVFGPGSVYLFLILTMKVSKEQQSIIAITAGFLVVAWIRHSYIFLLTGLVIAITFPFPVLNRLVHQCWMLLSKVLGWISSHIILSVFFYLILTPISLLRKLLGRQEMKIFSKNETTVFYKRDHIYRSGDFLNPW